MNQTDESNPRRPRWPALTPLLPLAIVAHGERCMTAVKERRRAGKKIGNGHVVLSRKRYDRLMEDLHDLAVVAERRNEPSISVDEMTKRLRKRGLL